MLRLFLLLIISFIVGGCANYWQPTSLTTNLKHMITINSSQFESGDVLPTIFTCDGQGDMPELIISDVPIETKSLAITLDDPDAPSGLFTHWLIYNIPPNTNIISGNLPQDASIGNNTTGRQNYFPPCPPSGSHRYIFTIYALDRVLEFSGIPSRNDFDQAISGHIIDTGELLSIYSRKH